MTEQFRSMCQGWNGLHDVWMQQAAYGGQVSTTCGSGVVAAV
jgi:hypothetical protein